MQKSHQQANFGGKSRIRPGWAKHYTQAPKWNLRHLPGLSFASQPSWYDTSSDWGFSGNLVRIIRHFLYNLQDWCDSPTLFEWGWSGNFWCFPRMVLPRLQDLSRLRTPKHRQCVFGPIKHTSFSRFTASENFSSSRASQRGRFTGQLNQPHAFEQHLVDWSDTQRARHAQSPNR